MRTARQKLAKMMGYDTGDMEDDELGTGVLPSSTEMDMAYDMPGEFPPGYMDNMSEEEIDEDEAATELLLQKLQKQAAGSRKFQKLARDFNEK